MMASSGNDGDVFFVGTSGWHYRDWSGRCYPSDLETSRWLRYYSSRFSTVELDSSFYRLPERSTFNSWRSTVPDGFVMTVKTSRYITHIRRCTSGRTRRSALVHRRRGRPELGPVLFQLPPNLEVRADRLRDLLLVSPARCEPRSNSGTRRDSFPRSSRCSMHRERRSSGRMRRAGSRIP